MTILLAAGVGPLVGTALVLGLASVEGGLSPEAKAAAVQSLFIFFMLGYVFGGLQATLCGVVFAAYGWSSDRLPIWVPIVIALPLALVFNLIVFGATGGSDLLFSVLIHLVPALVVWWLVKAYWKRTEA